jgi:hypothetical protein
MRDAGKFLAARFGIIVASMIIEKTDLKVVMMTDDTANHAKLPPNPYSVNGSRVRSLRRMICERSPRRIPKYSASAATWPKCDTSQNPLIPSPALTSIDADSHGDQSSLKPTT